MEVRVPQLAEGVEAGTVVSVLVKEGESVKKDQVLIELETNKAVATIPSPGPGNISKISVKEGDEVPVGALLMVLSQNGSAAAPSAAPEVPQARSAVTPAAPVSAAPSVSAPAAQPAAQTGVYHYESKAGVNPPASPTIRKIAAEVGIDLARVKGSESGGRIVLADLKAYLNFLQARAFSGVSEAAAPQAPASAKPAQAAVDFSKFGPVTRKKMTPLRKTISAQMLASWSVTPRVTQFDDVQVDQVMAVRKALVEDYKKKGASLTVTPFILKAVVATLKKHPIFNSSMDEAAGEIVYKDYFNIGIAVDTEQGLIVPVIRNVDQKSILDLSVELADLAQRTRDRKVGVEDLQGATFTISNQGMIGGTHFTPIINKPEVAILGIGRGGPKPVVEDGKKIVIQNRMPIALSYDHRVIDGGSAARFVVDFAEALNQFSVSDLRLGGSKQTAAKAAVKTAAKSAKKKKGKK